MHILPPIPRQNQEILNKSREIKNKSKTNKQDNKTKLHQENQEKSRNPEKKN